MTWLQSQGRTFFNSLKAFGFLKYNFKVFPVVSEVAEP